MARNIRFRDFDWFLLGCVLLIATLGVIEIYSATHNTRFAGMHMRQVLWISIGLALMLAATLLDYHTLLDQAPALYVGTVALLAVVLVVGHTAFGSRRWIRLGDLTFQVAELAKLAIIIVLARYLSEIRTDRILLPDLIKVAFLAGIPMGMVALQPDLGTALTFVPIVAVGIFLAGLRARHAFAALLLGALLLPVGWQVLRPYQRERLLTFAHPQEDPLGSGYQITQSKIAVGSGGFWGKGVKQGSQNQLGFIPVRHTDFIFAAFAEEQGFAGVVVALLLYLMVFLRLFHNAQTAQDRAGMFLVMGVLSLLAFHLLVNVGMVIGYMPVTGIPLPLMSYGGSVTLATFLALGLIMNVRLRRFVN